MKNLLYTSMAAIALLFTACSSESLTPLVDTTPEYQAQLEANASKSEVDARIYEWYQKYGTAVLYDFRDAEFSWLWAGKFNKVYTKFDPTSAEDMEKVGKLLDVIESKLFSKYTEDVLKSSLPYRIFLVKELKNTTDPDASSASYWKSVMSNDQDAIIVGYGKKGGAMFSASDYETELGNAFGTFFFAHMTVKPEKFLASRVPVKFNLVTWPVDAKIQTEQKTKPDWENTAHAANVCGYIKGYTLTGVMVPTEAQDYSDYKSFITENPGSYIRLRTQFYWRMAMRGKLFIEYYQLANGENLIETQNKKFPEDKVTLDDFAYTAQ